MTFAKIVSASLVHTKILGLRLWISRYVLMAAIREATLLNLPAGTAPAAVILLCAGLPNACREWLRKSAAIARAKVCFRPIADISKVGECVPMSLLNKLRFAALLGSSRASFIRGDVQKTLLLLDAADELRPLPPVYQVFKSMALTRSGRRDEAAKLLQAVIKQWSSPPDTESKYALTYAQLLQALASENFELAEVLFDRAKGISVRASVRRALPLLIRPSICSFVPPPV